MNNIKLIFISLALLFLGILFFLHQESWIILSFPTINPIVKKNNISIQPKETPLWIWSNGTLKKETAEIIFSNDHAQTIKLLINSWLTALEEENIIYMGLSEVKLLCYNEIWQKK